LRCFLSASAWSGLANSPFPILSTPLPTYLSSEPSSPGTLDGGTVNLETSPFPLEETFLLNSLPTATKTIYLDFNGHLTQGTDWNTLTGLPSIVTPAFSLDADVNIFTPEERLLVQRIWERVTEDFRPFEVNVTTEDPGIEALRNSGGGDDQWGIRILIGGDGTNDWYTPTTGQEVGGVAYLTSFNWASDTPAFVFGKDYTLPNPPDAPPPSINQIERGIAETISHEAGHTLGLGHDGQRRYYLDTSDQQNPEWVEVFLEYYGGHGASTNLPTAWSPIMGNGNGPLSQWSIGEYFNATNIEDDLEIITTDNGFDYRVDDHGSTIVDAGALDLDEANDLYSAEGIIERNTDIDYFSFEVDGLGEVLSFDINPFQTGPNLDVLARLYNSAGVELYRTNPVNAIVAGTQTFGGADGGWAKLDAQGNVLSYVSEMVLVGGTYYITVEGAARPIMFVDPNVHPGPVAINPDDDELPPDLSDWGYSNYGSLGYYSINGSRKANLVVGVDFDDATGNSPLNWTLFSGGGTTGTLNNLISETGVATPYDLTVTTTGTALTAVASTAPITNSELPDHSLPLDNLNGYLTTSSDETLSFVWSDLTPGDVYQVFVFGHASMDVVNEVKIRGGYWNGLDGEDPETPSYSFTQTVQANGMAVNADDFPGGIEMSTMGLYVIATEEGTITIEVDPADARTAGIAGVAITPTELGSISGQKWHDDGGGDPNNAGNGGGQADPGEEGLPGWMVYLDLDNNGVLNTESTPERTVNVGAPLLPQAINDYSIIKNESNIVEDGTIQDVNLTLNITHTYTGDLNIWLMHPDWLINPIGPNQVGADFSLMTLLVADRGGNGDNFTNTTFDDSAPTSISSASAPFTGTFRPMDALSKFNGMNAGGKWTLWIEDDGGGQTGTLQSWSMEIKLAGTTTFTEPFQVTDSEGNYTFADLKPGVYFVREHFLPDQLEQGWAQSWAPPKVLVTSKGDITGVDFGNWIPLFIPGAVTGQVWNDVDGDGEKEEGELGQEGWVVYLDADNDGERDIDDTPSDYFATGLPRPITDFATVTSTVVLSDPALIDASIVDLTVTIDISHTFMNDLEAFLTSPSGRTVELFSQVGGQFDDFDNITFDDDAERSIESIGGEDWPYSNDTYRPEGFLAEFFGDATGVTRDPDTLQIIPGVWTLTLRDSAGADVGTLNSWKLTFSTGERFTTTDADGNYTFGNLPAGTYIVREEVQPGWAQTYAPELIDDGTGGFYNVTVVGGAAAQVDFGNTDAGPDPPGDYNRDTVVNAADYVVFRKFFPGPVDNPYDGADGDGSGSVDAADEVVWRTHFGETPSGSGSSLVASAGQMNALSGMVSSSERGPHEAGFEAAPRSTESAFVLAETADTDNDDASGNEERTAKAGTTPNDAAILALLDSFSDDSRSDDDLSLSSSDDADDYFAGDGELDAHCDEDGVDALFELIGA
jgi:subtilisin-like proprotein convertase family protein